MSGAAAPAMAPCRASATVQTVLPTSVPQWLTTREIAAIYNRSERTIRHWCSTGTLTAFNIRVRVTGVNRGNRRYWILHQPEVLDAFLASL